MLIDLGTFVVKSETLKLLYIESNSAIREKNASIIVENGIKVFETDTLAGARDLMQTHQIDLILMDIILPNENGLDFIRLLRQRDISIPIIITTSNADKEILLDIINLDITRYLIKPFQKNDLLDALSAVAKKRFHSFASSFTRLHDGYSYDPLNKSVNSPDGNSAKLSKKEYRLIELLISNPQKIIPYSTIESTVWEGSYMSMDALRTLVCGIRKKTYPGLLNNHNGIGYKIDL